ncbi:MAG: ABC transporter permease [Lachnospiraceae bacterium]|nr:ABC transporter permease [Lachnospiraceae bacterium]
MKRFWIWFQTEYKRAALRLPAALGRAVILLGLVGMIAFCAQKIRLASADREPVQIGYAAEESPLIRMAVSYVENMEAVKGLCRFVPVAEEEGKALLAEGELAALLVLPENMIEGILSGSNEPAGLYLAENPSPTGLVFEELANAATGMLAVAQAEIYAAHALTEYFHVEPYGLEQMYQELDTFNLGIVTEREQFFRFRQLSETGNTGFAVYYAGAFFTVYLLVAGMFLGGLLKRDGEEMLLLQKRGGISYAAQFLGRSFITAGCLLLLLFVTGFLWLSGGVREAVRISWSLQGMFLVVLAVFCVASWLQLIYLLAESARSAILPAGFAAVFMCYISGCFVPSAILPKVVNRLAAVMPTTYIKAAFTTVFSGSGTAFWKTAAALCLFFGVFWLCSLFAAQFGGSRQRGEREVSAGMERRSVSQVPVGTEHKGGPQENVGCCTDSRTKKGPLLFWILAKRLLWKKTIWICLAGMVLLSVLQYNLEKQSDTVITAAVYTPDTELRELISEYDGLVHFLICSDSEEVKRNVMRGNAECGYVLQEDLQKKILAGDGVWSIEVYEKADSTMTRVVNEVLFERIFYAISTEWFEGYIAEHEMFAGVLQEVGEETLREEAGRQFVRKLSDDSTFSFEKLSISGTVEPAGGRAEAHTAYPTKAAAGAGIVLCGIVGVLEALQDIRKRRFRGKTALFAGIFTVLQPVLCGTAAALFIVGMTGKWSGFGGAAAALLLLAAAVFLVGIGAVRIAHCAMHIMHGKEDSGRIGDLIWRRVKR